MTPSNYIDLGFRPRPWQTDSLKRRKRFNVEVVHRRGGKTVKEIARTIDAALRCTLLRPHYGYIAPELKQAKGIAWEYIKQYTRPIPGVKVNESELWVELPNNSARIRIFGADNPESLRGFYFDGVVMDEVADMKPEVWSSIILPALLDRGGWADFIGTPKGINLFSEMYYRALQDPDWYASIRTVYDTGALSQAEIDLARASMTEAQFRQEFLCDFTAGSENALLSVDEVQAAAGRHLREDQFSFAAKVIGVDVARQGDDRTVIFRRQGLAAFKPIVMHKADSMEVAARVISEMTAFGPDAVFVDGTGGYGAGVIDRLRMLGHSPVEVQFAARATDPRFTNKRTEMYWDLAEWLKSGGALPDLAELKVELCTPTYDHKGNGGSMRLEAKDAIKARMGKSPDMADALALTFAFDVAPGVRGLLAEVATNQSGRAVTDYDPFNR
ncbi:terminase family protein [Luteibacter sp.]|uniref:terminase large subunit domain-containing protein n=1 Tax=Luteibacter sp. TaxID=1886636 RepID=UPI002808735C|nr:terminase family protein [Luteibacter sp.]MDQ8050726.1 terminase family protein [Luteibacter sp.]